MINIERNFDSDRGLLDVEDLSGFVFNSEAYAHTFIITPTGTYGFEEAVTARFFRADGKTVYINDENAYIAPNGKAYITLPPECYEAPGVFVLTIFSVLDHEVACIYAAKGKVTRSESNSVYASDGTETNIDNQIRAILSNLSSTINTANLVAAFARNIGDVEGSVEQFQTTVDGIVQALAAADVRALNGPNLLKQPQGVTANVPSGNVITETITIPIEDATAAAETLTYTVSNENITAGMVLHGIKSGNTSVLWAGMVTGTAAAGSMAISVSARAAAHSAAFTVTLYICNVTSAVLPYGEEARAYAYGYPAIDSTITPNYTGDPGEQISERLVTLTGANIVTDLDGATYDTAVAFTVQNAPSSGMNNADMLYFNFGNNGYDSEHAYKASLTGEFPELVVGKKYTLSCFARITSGTSGRVKMSYGCKSRYGHSSIPGAEKFIDISNTAWQRIHWTFVFNPTSEQYYTITESGVTYYRENWGKRVSVGVCRYADGTVQLCGFRLTEGGLMGDNTVDTLTYDVQEAQQDVAGMQSDLADLIAGITPNIETEMKASANYSSGEIIAVGAKLYQATAAIASGATLTVGTNVASITLVDYIAQLIS